jgi:dihydropteroate synthase
MERKETNVASRGWRFAGREMPLDRPRVMGIINVTPDSFSDGGRWAATDAAVAHGLALAAQGADILDVGGESTRPGAAAVPLEEELRRVVPVVRELARQTAVPVSVDTSKAAVARQALAAGACIVNDVTAMTGDPEMPAVVACHGAGIVLMHMRGTPRDMQCQPCYADVVAEVHAALAGHLAAARQAGVAPEAMLIDPGIGFGKTVRHNLELLAGLPKLAALAPVLVGASRKRFIGELTGAPVEARLAGSLAVAIWCVQQGAAVVRVHDVGETCAALRVWAGLASCRSGGASEQAARGC